MRSYRVIHLPAYRDPYQESLLDNLKAIDIDVKYGKSFVSISVIDISILHNIFKQFKFHIIHLHWQHPFLITDSKFGTIVKASLFIGQLVIAKVLGVKIVWTVHNITDHENKYNELELLFCKILAHCVDAIIVHCRAAKCNIKSVYKIKKKDNIFIIPHGNFLNYFRNTVSQSEARNQLKISSRDLTFLFLGLIRPYKGVLELIDSFQKLDVSPAKLIIAGKVPNEQLADRICKKAMGKVNIRLLFGHIPDDEIQNYMNAANIFVLPYRDILTSGGVLTGMSFGKAIISPNIGCIPEVLDSSGGFFYDPDERDGLLIALKQATKVSRARILEMGNYNLERAKKLNWRDIAMSTCRVYEFCLGRSK